MSNNNDILMKTKAIALFLLGFIPAFAQINTIDVVAISTVRFNLHAVFSSIKTYALILIRIQHYV